MKELPRFYYAMEVEVTETKEKVKVFADIKGGKTVCICLRSQKRCGKKCTPDVVERDKFRDWEKTMNRNRYGRSKE